MNKIKEWIAQLSIQQIRTSSFVFAIIFYLSAYISYSGQNYGGSFSSLIGIFGLFALTTAFNYKVEEKELNIHSFIRNQTDREPRKTFSFLALISMIVALLGTYFSFRSMAQVEKITKTNLGFQIILVFIFLLSFSFWKERKLKRRN